MNGLITFALRRRIFFALLLPLALIGGAAGFAALNIEAYPDPVPPLVDIVTQSSGQSAEEIERYVTVPIEIQMAGIPHVTSVRTISLFGLSDVKVQFTYDFTYDQAEQWVTNRLSQLPTLVNGATAQISPTSPIGEIYRYQVVGPPGYSVTDLKTLQDWVLERRFKAVPGVVDVTGWGGKTRTYDIEVDPHRLEHYGVTLPQVLQALGNSNINVGGQTIDVGPQSAVVRGVGLIHSVEDIGHTMVSISHGVPVRVADVAQITIGHQPRLGIAGLGNSDDIVQGIVLMRRGAESMPTIERVKDEIRKINGSGLLPPGVRIERIYDRSDLIRLTTRTVLHNVLAGIVLIFLLQWAFLGNLRSAIIVACTIPFALAFAIGLMLLRGESANLLSVGAIDFGLIVDATVIMVENIFRHLSESAETRRAGGALLQVVRGNNSFRGKFGVIANAAMEVNQSILFAAAIIIAGFVPLFTLSGIEGHIFGPMARTYAYAIAGGLLATFTLSPALCALLLPDSVTETETLLVRYLRLRYEPVVEFTLANRIITLGALAILLVIAGVAAHRLGLEFMPRLEEGNFWIRATMPTSVSQDASNGYVNQMRRLIGTFPEVDAVISQHGRPDDGTDATGFFNAEFFVPLKAAGSWPRGVDKETLTRQLKTTLSHRFPGVDFNFSQYIEDNVEEAASGVKGENSVKLFGSDLNVLAGTAEKIRDVLQTVPGITDLAVVNPLGQPTIRIDVDRERASRLGLAPGDINSTVQSAIGGQSAGDLYEAGSDRHFPMMVRLAQPFRADLDSIRRIWVGAPDPTGAATPVQIPLADVAQVRLVSGPSFIYREQQERYVPIKFSVRGRDLGGTVLDAQARIARAMVIPGGYHLEWAGEFGNLNDALQRLKIAVPVSLALICVLLFINFGSIIDVLLAVSVIPMALIGGIFALALTGTPFSVSAAIGFVALFGIATMDGIIVLSYYNLHIEQGMDRINAIVHTCRVQMRPVMMTCIVACVGLMPAAVSTGIGSQVQRPLALVVVGGMLLTPLLVLFVLPSMILLASQRRFVAPATVE